MADPATEETVTGEIEKQLERGKSLKITAGVVAFFVALGAAGLAWFLKFETRDHADGVHAQAEKQIERLVIDTEILKALAAMVDRRMDRMDLNIEHLADRMGARKEPPIELAPPPLPTQSIGPSRGR